MAEEIEVNTDENSDYMYDVIARILKEAPTRAPCSDNEQKGAEVVQQELQQYCDEVHMEDFTCYPRAFLGFISLDAGILLIAFAFFLLTIFQSWTFAAVGLGLAALAILIFVEQFLRYEEFTPK